MGADPGDPPAAAAAKEPGVWAKVSAKASSSMSSGATAYINTQTSSVCGAAKMISLLGPEFNPFYTPLPVRAVFALNARQARWAAAAPLLSRRPRPAPPRSLRSPRPARPGPRT